MKYFITIFILLFFSCSSAQHIRISGTEKTGKIILEPNNSKAKCSVKNFAEWSFLFNIIPISSPTMDEMFPDPEKTYRIFEQWTWTDILISVPLAYLTTITTRSLVIESCEVGGVVALTNEDLNNRVNEEITKMEADSISKVDTFIEKQTKKHVRNKIILHSGAVIEGELFITKEKRDYIEIGVTEPRPTIVRKKILKKQIKEIE